MHGTTVKNKENFLAPSWNWIVKCLDRLACGLVTVPCELSRRDCEACKGVFALQQSVSYLLSGMEQSRINLGV